MKYEFNNNDIDFVIESMIYAKQIYQEKAVKYWEEPGYMKIYNAKMTQFENIINKLRRRI